MRPLLRWLALVAVAFLALQLQSAAMGPRLPPRYPVCGELNDCRLILGDVSLLNLCKSVKSVDKVLCSALLCSALLCSALCL